LSSIRKINESIDYNKNINTSSAKNRIHLVKEISPEIGAEVERVSEEVRSDLKSQFVTSNF